MNFDLAGFDIVRFAPPFLLWGAIFFLILWVLFFVLHRLHMNTFRNFYNLNRYKNYTEAKTELIKKKEAGEQTGVRFTPKTDDGVLFPATALSLMIGIMLLGISSISASNNMQTYNDNLIYETIQSTYDVELTHADVDKLATDGDAWVRYESDTDKGATWVEYGSTKIVSETNQITEVTLVRVKGVYKLISIIDEENETFEEIALK